MKETLLAEESCFESEASLRKNAAHPDWRVRYAAAVAIGESGNAEFLPLLEQIVKTEKTRPLYSQPSCHFENAPDDTAMAEMVGPIRARFDKEYDDFTLQAWQCRGRVLQAAYFAYAKLGKESKFLNEEMFRILKEDVDDAAMSAGYVAFAACGGKDVYDRLVEIGGCTHYCAGVEREKTLRILREKCKLH